MVYFAAEMLAVHVKILCEDAWNAVVSAGAVEILLCLDMRKSKVEKSAGLCPSF